MIAESFPPKAGLHTHSVHTEAKAIKVPRRSVSVQSDAQGHRDIVLRRNVMNTYPEALDVKIEIEGLDDHRSSLPQRKPTGRAQLLPTYRPRSKPCIIIKPPI